jgi:hypothetical protein
MTTIFLFLVGIIFIHSGIYRFFGQMDWYKRFSNMRGRQSERTRAQPELESISFKGLQSTRAYSGILIFAFGVAMIIAGAWFSR